MNMEYSSPSSSGSSISSDSDGTDTWKGGVPGCARCGNIIYDKKLLYILDKVWHPSCLQCTVCNKELGSTCYSDGSNILCYDDYIRSYSFKCSGCKMMLSDQEFVRRVHGNVYHQTCFQCACCERPLQTGEKFYLRDDDKLVCAEDYDAWKIKESDLNDSDSECSSGSGKRYRTNLTPKQLHCLVTAYEKNSKPSRDTRRRLSRDLRLDYRVIQVWFQNKRAKCKKPPRFNHQFQQSTMETAGFNHNRYHHDIETGRRFPAPPSFHENLYKAPRRINNGEWLTTALAHDSIPPNIELSHIDIVNGEINNTFLQKRRPQSETEKDNIPSSSTDTSCSWQRIV